MVAKSKVNANLGEVAFGGVEEIKPKLEFQRLLAREMIKNSYSNNSKINANDDGIAEESAV